MGQPFPIWYDCYRQTVYYRVNEVLFMASLKHTQGG